MLLHDCHNLLTATWYTFHRCRALASQDLATATWYTFNDMSVRRTPPEELRWAMGAVAGAGDEEGAVAGAETSGAACDEAVATADGTAYMAIYRRRDPPSAAAQEEEKEPGEAQQKERWGERRGERLVARVPLPDELREAILRTPSVLPGQQGGS